MGRTTFTIRAISRLLIVGTIAATSLFAFPGTSWASDRTHAAEELSFANKINAHRRARNLAPLKFNLQLTGVARSWSDKMAAAGGISHNPQLANQVEGDWTRLGENVGYSSRSGTSGEEFVRRLDEAFMASPGHKANVVGDYNQVGVGVRMTGHTMWVTVNFMKSRTVVSNGSVYEAAQVAGRVFTASSATGRHASYVVITASDQPSHALSAAALAGDKGPLLYTHPADSWDESPVLHPRTRAEVDRLLGGGGVVYVVGGTQDVSERAVRELTNDGYSVKRLSAASAPATSVRVGEETIRRHGANGRVVIARTGDWQSAATASVWAARSGTPFLVTPRARLHPSVRGFLNTYKPAKRWVVGPTRSISHHVKVAAGARRISGRSASATSVQVAKKLWRRTDASNGDRWASTPGSRRQAWGYTLAYASWAAVNNGPALLMGNTSVPAPVRSYLAGLGYGSGKSGRVTAATPVPRPVVSRVESLVSAP